MKPLLIFEPAENVGKVNDFFKPVCFLRWLNLLKLTCVLFCNLFNPCRILHSVLRLSSDTFNSYWVIQCTHFTSFEDFTFHLKHALQLFSSFQLPVNYCIRETQKPIY
jgi:hypothetical protein